MQLENLSEQEETPTSGNKQVVIEFGSFKTATKVYSQVEAFIRGEEDVAIVFGIKSPVTPPKVEGIPFIPHTVCYMGVEHFKDFVELLNVQLKRIEEES